jgi:hypothetical protein
MPTSIDRQPAEDEVECARCGAIIYYELTRCPNCGVNLYEPEDEADLPDAGSSGMRTRRPAGIPARLAGFIRRLTRKPDRVDELFGTAIDQAALYHDLLNKVGGDRSAVERLIDYERQQVPQGNRIAWLRNAIQRWQRDNRGINSKAGFS